MNVEEAIREAIRLAGLAARWFGWVVKTLWLGTVLVIRLVRVLIRLPRLFAHTLRCPRGHENDLYGVWRCHCGGVVEGHVFRTPCPVCRQVTGWLGCERCGLPIVR